MCARRRVKKPKVKKKKDIVLRLERAEGIAEGARTTRRISDADLTLLINLWSEVRDGRLTLEASERQMFNKIFTDKRQDIANACNRIQLQRLIEAGLKKDLISRLTSAEAVVANARVTRKISDTSFTELIKLWSEVRDGRLRLEAAERQRFNEIFTNRNQDIVNACNDRQLERLISAGLSERGAKRTAVPRRVIFGRSHRFRFFPEALLTSLDNSIVSGPDPELSDSFAERMEDGHEQGFRSQIGRALEAQALHGTGSEEAMRAGRDLIKHLDDTLPGKKNWEERLGPDYEQILRGLGDGDIARVLDDYNIAEGVQEKMKSVHLYKPTLLLRFGIDAPIKDWGTRYKLCVSGLFALDILAGREEHSAYDEETERTDPRPSPKMPIRAGAKVRLEFPSGMEFMITPSAVLRADKDITRTSAYRLNLTAQLRDTSGKIEWRQNSPIYYGVLLEYESPNTSGESSNALRYGGDIGVTLFRYKGRDIVVVLGGEHSPYGKRTIPTPEWLFDPGVVMKRRGTQLGLRSLVGKDTVGGGAVLSQGSFSLSADLAGIERSQLDGTRKKELFGGFELKLKFK